MPADEEVAELRQMVGDLRAELARQQRQARSRELARIAAGQLDVDPERAVLLALEANAAAVTFESRDALQQAVSASRLRWVFGGSGVLFAYFTGNNRHVVTAGRDGVLRWWDLEARSEVAALNCGDGVIEGLQPSPGRERALVTARASDSARYRRSIIDLVERRVVTAIDEEAVAEDDATTVTAFFSRDGRRLLLTSEYWPGVSLWDATTGVRLYRAEDVGRCHGLDGEGRRALVTRQDNSVVVLHLDGEGGATPLQVPPENGVLASFCGLHAGPLPFSPDGTRVTAGTGDRVAWVWDARDGQLLHTLGDRCPSHSSAASFTPSGQWVLVQQNDSVQVEVWDAATAKLQCRLPHSSAFHVPLRSLPFPPRPGVPEYALVGMGDSHGSWPPPVDRVSEWDAATGAIRSQFRLPGKRSFQRCFGDDGAACHWGERTEHEDISLDADRVLRVGDGAVRVFARVEPAEAAEAPAEYGCGFTADRQVSHTAEGQTLMDSRTGRTVARLGTPERFLFSPDGRHLVTVPYDGSKPVVRVWDARSGELRFTVDGYDRRVTTLQFQPGRGLLLIGSEDRTMRLWSLETGREAARATVDAPDGPSYEAACTPDGTKVAFATSGRLHVWHVDRGEVVQAPTTLYARDPRFSADGAWLLAGDGDVACIWETATMQPVGQFPWHFAGVMSGDLSPDKKLAATHGQDGRVRLWEAPGGREITHWPLAADHWRRPLRFSADGAYLYGGDGRRLIVAVEQLVALAKTRVFRELDPAERRLFLGEGEG